MDKAIRNTLIELVESKFSELASTRAKLFVKESNSTMKERGKIASEIRTVSAKLRKHRIALTELRKM